MIHTIDEACQSCTRVYWKDTIWQICPSKMCWPSVKYFCVCEELVDNVEWCYHPLHLLRIWHLLDICVHTYYAVCQICAREYWHDIGICCASDGSSVILWYHQLHIHWESGRTSVCMIHTNDATCQTCTRVYHTEMIQLDKFVRSSVKGSCVCKKLVLNVEWWCHPQHLLGIWHLLGVCDLTYYTVCQICTREY